MQSTLCNNMKPNLEKVEISREHIELDSGKMGDLVKYDVKDYGTVDYVENIEVGNGQFRRDRAMLPFNYLDKKASDFNWDVYGVDMSNWKKLANAFIVNFREWQQKGKGLYICSHTKGSGKTLLACCLANEIMEQYDISVKFISIPELLEMTKKSYSDFAEKGELKSIQNAGLLILDDIGTETKKEWIDTELFRLIDSRYSNNRLTIFTSNLELNQLKLNDRIVDRIYSMCIQLNLPEKSIRRMQVNNENSKFLKRVLSCNAQ